MASGAAEARNAPATRAGLSWQAWAPPLDPPTAGGLDAAAAQAIADVYWSSDPHLCAALQWEAYAATLPPAPSVSSVATGAQTVAYQPPMPGGDYGAAMSRAAWHRSLMSSLDTAVLVIAPPPVIPGIMTPPSWPFPPGGWWDGVPPAETAAPVASFTLTPPNPIASSDVTCDGSASRPGAGAAQIVRYDWTFPGGDTRPDAGPVVTWHVPGGSFEWLLRLDVTDNLGGTAFAEMVVDIP